ncbi:hypothetical protein RFI_16190 [Reticulomyxa filosa]|uniref:AP-4 complex subunit epsilon-1 C-terminal domain-containing protein n=1 Tax=Reticulomyxa filosa TaxID=46433 RepID=X6N5J4_RETFI|nr:hypothetical protein RFI_16190 [Reticulomyxa filosa]|eukprot:ETO21014.1 hypothetical protein RFI_16190 [Reticulomyxa filosa]
MTGVSAMSSSGGKRGFAALTELHSKLSMYPRYPNNDELLSSSINCQVTYFKMYKQQQTSLCLFIANVSTAQMANVTISINLSSATSNLQVGFDVSNSIPKPKLMNARTAVIDSIASNQTIGQFISIGNIYVYNILQNVEQRELHNLKKKKVTTNPLAVQVPVSINVTIAYQVGVTKEQLTATVTIAGRDLLRSCAMDTATFGKNWPTMKNETKVVVTPSTCPSLPDYLVRIKQLQLSHIQTINLECIAAAQLPSIDATNTLPVLVHCKVMSITILPLFPEFYLVAIYNNANVFVFLYFLCCAEGTKRFYMFGEEYESLCCKSTWSRTPATFVIDKGREQLTMNGLKKFCLCQSEYMFVHFKNLIFTYQFLLFDTHFFFWFTFQHKITLNAVLLAKQKC